MPIKTDALYIYTSTDVYLRMHAPYRKIPYYLDFKHVGCTKQYCWGNNFSHTDFFYRIFKYCTNWILYNSKPVWSCKNAQVIVIINTLMEPLVTIREPWYCSIKVTRCPRIPGTVPKLKNMSPELFPNFMYCTVADHSQICEKVQKSNCQKKKQKKKPISGECVTELWAFDPHSWNIQYTNTTKHWNDLKIPPVL